MLKNIFCEADSTGGDAPQIPARRTALPNIFHFGFAEIFNIEYRFGNKVFQNQMLLGSHTASYTPTKHPKVSKNKKLLTLTTDV